MPTPIHAVTEMVPTGLPMLGAMPLADGVAELYLAAQAPLRAKLLECLLRPLGALALVAVADGVFGALRSRHGWQRLQVLEDDTLDVSTEQVRQLVVYLQQSAPEVFGALAELLQRQSASGLVPAWLSRSLQAERFAVH